MPAGVRKPPDLGPTHSSKPGGRHKSPVHHFANADWCPSAIEASASIAHCVAPPGLKPFMHPYRWFTPPAGHMSPSGLRRETRRSFHLREAPVGRNKSQRDAVTAQHTRSKKSGQNKR